MYLHSALITVLFLTLVKGSMSTAYCPKDVVNITASLKPGWKYEIQSPGFPNHYPANTTCTWRVSFPDSMGSMYTAYRMSLQFQPSEIEPCSGCACDYLAYGDREEDLQKPSNKICNIYSKNYISYLKETSTESLGIISGYESKKEWWLRFHSDHSSEFKGFKGKITVAYNSYKCANNINDTSGSISSPKYPSKYLSSQSITWCLISPKGFRVKLNFTAFELENTRTSDNDCLNDYVEVRDGFSGDGELLGRFCGDTIPDEIFSLSNQMWVLFVSDSNATTLYKGFDAHFVNGKLMSNVTSVNGGDLVKSSFTSLVLAMMGLIMKQVL